MREQARNTRKHSLREQKAALSELLFGSCNQTIMHFHLDCRHDKRSFSLAAKALVCDFSCLRGDIDVLASCWLFACSLPVLIVLFWYASAAYQGSLVEPWFVFWRDAVEPKCPWRDQTSLICCRSVLKKGAISYLPYPNSS